MYWKIGRAKLAARAPARPGGRCQVAADVAFLAGALLLTGAAFRVWLPSVPAGWLSAFPSAVLAMHVRLAMGFTPMVVQLSATAILLSVLAGGAWTIAGQVVAGGFVGAVLVSPCSRRGCVIRAGLWAGAAAAGAGVAALLLGQQDPTSLELASVVAACGLGGALAGPILIAFSPIAEWFFGHVTALTLSDALSYDQPLLRRLMTAAPGTFQHSVNVGLLGDAAARAIGADALLVRLGALYHDVGKTMAPEYFVENQGGGENPHDRLPPMESAKILRAHVADGLALVLEHGLGERIADFVGEHHGTGVMRSFVAKAGGDDPRDAQAFRYSGPRPRSRETGILMIADQVEAAARAAVPATALAYRAFVRKTIKRIREEGELDDSGLGAAELTAVEAAFLPMLRAMHHRRLDYSRERRGPSRLTSLLRPRART